MKGRSPTVKQKAFHSRLAELGCVACKIDGYANYVVSIHHIAGRTKLDAHWLVLPLCAGHHQDGAGIPGLVSVHPWKRRFEAKYGNQYDLLDICHKLLFVAGLSREDCGIKDELV